MKPKHLHLLTSGALSVVMPASADVIYSDLQNIGIPATFDGLYLNVETGGWNVNTGEQVPIAGVTGWDINPFYGGRAFANSPDFQPVRSATASDSPILNLAAGATVGSGSVFSTFVQGPGGETAGAPGYGGSQMLTGSGGNFTAGTEGYLGFRLNGTDYGWMRVVLTNNTGGAVIKDWAYDNTGGAAIATGNVLQNGSTVTLDSTFGSFTLGSPITGGNSVVKNSANTATLDVTNAYTGATTVSAGTLAVSGTGNINTTSGISVAAGASLRYNSSTALTVAPVLAGNGISNRAVLGGTGTINAAVTLDNLGDVLSPGNSPGIQNYAPAQTWASFSYDWEVNDFTGTTAGTDFDQITAGSTLDFTGGSGAYNLNVPWAYRGRCPGPGPELQRNRPLVDSPQQHRHPHRFRCRELDDQHHRLH